MAVTLVMVVVIDGGGDGGGIPSFSRVRLEGLTAGRPTTSSTSGSAP
jgi:hypothetical protein